MEEAVEDGGGGRDVLDELAPFFDRAVRGHEGGTVFVSSHDDFEEEFTRFGLQLLDSHIVNDEQMGFEITWQYFFGFEVFLFEKISHHIEDGAVKHIEAGTDGAEANGLGDVRFSGTWRSDKKSVMVVADEMACGHILDLFFWEGGIEVPVEIFKGTTVTEGGDFSASLDETLVANEEFVLEDKFQELQMSELVGLGFLESDFETFQESGESKQASGLDEGLVHDVLCIFSLSVNEG